jgi:beta-lactamase regulating signal transducer with metallopeptidase domain
MHFLFHNRQIVIAAATLVHFLWQGTAIAAALALLLRAAHRLSSNSRYLLALAALFLMPLCPIVTAIAVAQNTHFMNDEVTEQYRIAAGSAPSGIKRDVREDRFTDARSEMGPDPRSNDRMWTVLRRLAPWIVLAWAAGAVTFSIRMLGGWLLAHRMARRGIEPHSASLASLFARLAERMGITRLPRLLVSAALSSPIMLGTFRTTILLPAGLLTGLTPQMVEAILAHELAHVRRHDYLVNMAQCVVETLLFFHPGVWWVSKRIREERELCCDDLVIATLNDRATYATALAKLEILRAQPLTLAANGGALPARIHRILGANLMEKTPRSPFAPAVAALALAAICGAVCLQAEPRPSAGDADRANQSNFITRMGAPLSGQYLKQNQAAMMYNCVQMELTQHIVDRAGRYKDRQIAWWNIAEPPGTGKSSFWSTRTIPYKLDITPRAVTNNSIGLQVRLAIPVPNGHGFRSASSARTLALGKKVRIIGLTSAADPALQKQVQSSEVVTRHGPYTAYYVDVKLVPAAIPHGPGPHVRPATLVRNARGGLNGESQFGPGSTNYRLGMQLTKCEVTEAGRHTETILARPAVITQDGAPAAIEVKDRGTGFRVDITPRSKRKNSVALQITLAVTPEGGSAPATNTTLRSVRLDKSTRILGAMVAGQAANDPTLRKKVQEGKLVTDRGAYTCYFLDVKPSKESK